MILSSKIIETQYLSEESLWVTTVGKNNICNLTRVSSFRVEKDKEHITFSLPKQLFSILEQDLTQNANMSFFMGSILNFESYQVKGIYKSHADCSEEDIMAYKLRIQKLVKLTDEMGLDGSGVFGYLSEGSGIAVTLFCKNMYNQTPKPETGGKLISDEN